MILKPQDILVLLKLVALEKEGDASWSYNNLAVDLSLSPSEVHAAIKRSLAARLAIKQQEKIVPSKQGLADFICHGIRYVFVPDRGEIVRGMPTGFAALPLSRLISQSDEFPPVWPDPEGEVRGVAFSPLYKSVPKAAKKDKALYELLVLVDGIRGGRAREREFAIKELKQRLVAI
ncbi:MAG: hypothetical protein IMF07_08635 [Proteobacteria bacterium]|nr:hypothetical protein [Pseudomonadota bacterium]